MIRKLIVLLLLVAVSCQKNQPPECLISSPEEGTLVYRGETLDVAVLAEDEDGTISEVRLFVDEIGHSFLKEFPYNFSLQTADLNPGVHIVTASARDDEGAEAKAELSFEVIEKEVVVLPDSVFGLVQKGPFLNGSDVQVLVLDSGLNQTGRTYSSTVADNSGGYHISGLELESGFVSLSATGYYFDEILSIATPERLELVALADLFDSTLVNINILTHLEKGRVKYLVGTGMSFREAKQQAQTEILDIFLISEESIEGSEYLDISRTGDGNAILLATSLIFQSGLTVADLSQLLPEIALDMLQDGVLDNPEIHAGLYNRATKIDTISVRSSIENRYAELGKEADVPHFEKYIDHFLQEKNPLSAEVQVKHVSCTGSSDGEIQITVEGGTEPYTITWASNGNVVDEMTGLSAGIYEASVTDSDGYRIYTSVEVLEPEQLSVQIVTIDDDLGELSGAIDISVSGGTRPYTFQWSNDSQEEDLQGVAYGNYSVLVSDSLGCSSSVGASVKGTFTDSRDENQYPVVPIGDQFWMGKNLAYLPTVNSKTEESETLAMYYVYGNQFNDLEMAKSTMAYLKYGALYNWVAAQDACPDGWHLPSDQEWKQLEMHLGMSMTDANKMNLTRGEGVNVGGKLKEKGTSYWYSPNAGANNESGFSARAGGYKNIYDSFLQESYVSYFWTSSLSGNRAYFRGLDYHNGNVWRSIVEKSYGYSVRCVKDTD